MINSCGALTGFYENINVVTKKQLNDENERVFILKVTIDNTDYLLINIYNGNTEQHQLETLQNLSILVQNFDKLYSKTVILACKFNLFFNEKLEYKGERKILKSNRKSYNKVTGGFWLRELEETLKKYFAFRQKHFSGIIQCSLDYLFISNSLQETLSNVDILNTF